MNTFGAAQHFNHLRLRYARHCGGALPPPESLRTMTTDALACTDFCVRDIHYPLSRATPNPQLALIENHYGHTRQKTQPD